MIQPSSDTGLPENFPTLAQRLSRNVAARRKCLQITQSQLAEQLSVEPETISRLERGKHLPSLAMLEKIARVLMTSIADLLAEHTGYAQPSNEALSVSARLSTLNESDRQFALKSLKQLCDHLASSPSD